MLMPIYFLCRFQRLFSKDFDIILPEFFNALIGQRMVRHLLDHLIRHRRDVRARQRTVRHMNRVAHARGDDLGSDIRIVAKIGRNRADQLDARLGDVVQPAQKRLTYAAPARAASSA